MKLGKYDQKISFITQGETSDTYGGVTPSEVVVLSTFARIEQLKTSANIEQAQLGLPAIFRVGVQSRSGFSIEPNHMVKWNNKLFNIIGTPLISSIRYNQEWVFDISAK